ncbi:MAG: hypothetical protein ACE5LH_04065 [Fidelibacterota bacterium]
MIFLAIVFLALFQNPHDRDLQVQEKEKLLNLIDAFMFASDTHELLHIMMGEETGDPTAAYREFSRRLADHDRNPELLSVRLAFRRISDPSHPEKTGAAELDALVDYHQLAFQFGYQAIFKAYGYFGEIPTSNRELARLSDRIRDLEDLQQLVTLFEDY